MEETPTTKQLGFARRVALATAIIVAIALVLVFLYYAIQVLFLAFAGVLMALVVRAASDWLVAKTNLSDTWAVSIVVSASMVLMVVMGFLVAPQISQQMDELREAVPKSLDQATAWLEEQAWGRRLLTEGFQLGGLDGAQIGEFFMRMTGLAYGTVNVVASIFVVGFLTLYLSISPSLYIDGFLRMIPFSYRPRAAQILGAVGYTLKWWLLASLIKMAAVGVMTYIGLWILDMPLAFILALLAFVLDFVPYFGPIIAAIPAVLLAFVDGPTQALYVVVMYTVVQQLESLLIAPILFHRTVYMPPVVTVVAQILLAVMAGVLGILLATPLTAAALTMIKMMYVEDVIGDVTDAPKDKSVKSTALHRPIDAHS